MVNTDFTLEPGHLQFEIPNSYINHMKLHH